MMSNAVKKFLYSNFYIQSDVIIISIVQQNLYTVKNILYFDKTDPLKTLLKFCFEFLT